MHKVFVFVPLFAKGGKGKKKIPTATAVVGWFPKAALAPC